MLQKLSFSASHPLQRTYIPFNKAAHPFSSLKSTRTWTEEEKEKLYELSTQNWHLKKIAFALNRSPAAINKALTRFNLRSDSPKVASFLLMKKRLAASTKQNSQKQPRKSPPLGLWVEIEDVIHWLAHQNITFKTTSLASALPKTLTLYRCQESFQLFTPGQLLVMANKLRLEQKLPLFHVQNITEP